MKNSAQGQRAYLSVRRVGGSKEEARQAAVSANESYYKSVAENQMSHSGYYNGDFGDSDDGRFYPMDQEPNDTDVRDFDGYYYE